MKRSRVKGWTGLRSEFPYPSQSREIVARRTLESLYNDGSLEPGQWRWSGSETWNDAEVALAEANPGRVLYRPLNSQHPGEWKAADGGPVHRH